MRQLGDVTSRNHRSILHLISKTCGFLFPVPIDAKSAPHSLRLPNLRPSNLLPFQVIRQGQLHSVIQFNVEILLDGPTDGAFTAADNSLIIPTDTQKNTVYVLAKTTSFDCAEEFGVIVARCVHLCCCYARHGTFPCRRCMPVSVLPCVRLRKVLPPPHITTPDVLNPEITIQAKDQTD